MSHSHSTPEVPQESPSFGKEQQQLVTLVQTEYSGKELDASSWNNLQNLVQTFKANHNVPNTGTREFAEHMQGTYPGGTWILSHNNYGLGLVTSSVKLDTTTEKKHREIDTVLGA